MSPKDQPETLLFPKKDLPLRRDVGWLGQLLGKLLQELGPPELFPTVETTRRLARRRRRAETGNRGVDAEEGARVAERLDGMLDDLEPDEALEVVRAFSAYFSLVNMAERVHRIRRRADRLRESSLQPGGLPSRRALRACSPARCVRRGGGGCRRPGCFCPIHPGEWRA
ncbi:MAG: phosphoenolpyruvate carboxylase, partial [Planctomycetota bacterium]